MRPWSKGPVVVLSGFLVSVLACTGDASCTTTSVPPDPGPGEIVPVDPGPLDGKKARKAYNLFRRGLDLLEDDQQKQAALAAFQELARLVPAEPGVHVNAAIASLRMRKPPGEVEVLARKALELEEDNPYAWGVLGSLSLDERDGPKAVEAFSKAAEGAPNEPQFRFLLIQSHGVRFPIPPEAKKRRAVELQALIRLVPHNIKVRLDLVAALRETGDGEGAIRELARFQGLAPLLRDDQAGMYEQALAAPGKAKEAAEALEAANAGEGAVFRELTFALHRSHGSRLGVTLDGLRKFGMSQLQKRAKSTAAGVRSSIIMFHNLMKNTPMYKMDVGQIKPAPGLDGVPQPTLSRKLEALVAPATPPEAIPVKFVEEEPIREGASAFSLLEVDGDGDDDLFVATEKGELLENDAGSFRKPLVTTEFPGEGVTAAITIDWEEDTDQDLILVGEDGVRVFLNGRQQGDPWAPSPPRKDEEEAAPEELSFEESTPEAMGKAVKGKAHLRAIDYDHDGDLDLLMGLETGPRHLFLNRLDGTFVDRAAQAKLAGEGEGILDAIGADIEDDGDIDILLLDGLGGLTLHRNLRQGLLEASPIRAEGGPFRAVAVADFDNDGLLDIGAASGAIHLFRNQGGGEMKSAGEIPLPDGFGPLRLTAFDYDNDGFQDLAAAGAKGLLLFRNVGPGRFEAAPAEVPDVGSLTDLAVSDIDRDGDLDLVILGEKGLRVLRNDGGNAHEWVDIRFRGRDTQFGRSNHFGRGSRAEMRAGDLYQLLYVQGAVTHFGLGTRKKADAIRLVWTNGIPQTHFDIDSRLDVREDVVLKGSCPFLYAWNGERFAFVTDCLGSSPLGLKVDETRYAWIDNEEYLKIRGDQLAEKGGEFVLQVTEELWECLYYDEGELLVVDHPAGVEIFPEEKFVPPPFPNHHIHAVSDLRPPKGAWDSSGKDVLPLLREEDGVYVDDFQRDRYQGIVTPHSLTLDLGDLGGAMRVRLFLNGWIYWTDTSINVAMGQSPSIGVDPPTLSVPDGSGGWKVVIPFLGFPAGKTKTVVHDLTGLLADGDGRVRIDTNVEIYWDQVLVSTEKEEAEHQVTRISPSAADLHFRGFSRLYREGPHSPHLYDYAQVTREDRWRDMEGYYTRYGDVAELVRSRDDRFVIVGAGDELTLRFPAGKAPPLREGWKRDFLLRSVGYDKDGDLNTTHGQTVGPLPFQGMSGYPYRSDEAYPDDAAHREYQRVYNTRWKGQEGFRAAVRSGEVLRSRSRGPGR